MASTDNSPSGRPRVLILGGGFAGVGAAQKLKDADAEVVLVDRHDYHTFQPLLYQLATGLLEETAVGHSLRDLVGHQKNTVVHRATVSGVERVTAQVLVAGAVSIVGVGLVIAGAGGALSSNLKGDVLALTAVATWALYTVTVAPLMTRHSPFRISAWVLTMTAILLTLVGSHQLLNEDYPTGWEVWAVFAFAVGGPLVVTNVLWFKAIDRVGPSRASLFANLQFFLAAVFGVILLSETITPLQVLGGATIGVAILLSRFQRAPAPQPVE